MDEARSADSLGPEVDESTSSLLSDLPSCPHCGGVARPAILMFGDREWIDHRRRAQSARLQGWCYNFEGLLVVVQGLPRR